MFTIARLIGTIVIAVSLTSCTLFTDYSDSNNHSHATGIGEIQLGPRPLFLVDGMTDSGVKDTLNQCREGPFYRTRFSIGHRGAPMQFPEHTKESYLAAARMGAGIIECDVTFTKDRELVCRHSQCDLHTTTNILTTDLANQCTQNFIPFDRTDIDPATGKPRPARATCCASDITLAQFKTLQGKMDTANREATSVEEYVSEEATASWRTDLYSARGTLMSHKESIELFKRLGVAMTPELKSPRVSMPYQGDYTQHNYAQQMINDYKAAGVSPNQVWPQSFNLDDVKYWIKKDPDFGRQAVFLDSRPYTDADFVPSLADFNRLKRSGVRVVAPPMFALLGLDSNSNIIPSDYAKLARMAELDIITWTFERTDLRKGGGNSPFYFRTIGAAIVEEGDKYLALDVLATKVKVLGVFSDWPATVTYYANCMGLE